MKRSPYEHPIEAVLDLAEQRLGEEGRAVLRAHLDVCEECRAELITMKWMRALHGKVLRTTAPAALRQRIQGALGDASKGGKTTTDRG